MMNKYEIIPLNGEGGIDPNFIDIICVDVGCVNVACGSDGVCDCDKVCACGDSNCADKGCNCGIWSRTLPHVE